MISGYKIKSFETKEVREPMKKLIGLLGILLTLTLLVPTKQAEADHRHGWLLPGLIIGGALGWGLAPRYYHPPPPPTPFPPPPGNYPPPPVYYPPPTYYYPPPTYYYPPSDEVSQGPQTGGQIYIYPRQGQSQEKLVNDRNECHNWAEKQTDYDPTKPSPSGWTESQILQKNGDYYRAMGACLDA